MHYLFDLWLVRDRHEELLREAARERLARVRRRPREARVVEPPKNGGPAAAGRTRVRQGLAGDAPGIAELLELQEMPRWLAFEERFIVAERGGKIAGVLRFRREPGRLYLGLLVTGPGEEGLLAARLCAGARTVARELGVRQIVAGTPRHRAHVARSGYREGRGGWRTDAGPV